MSIVNVDEDVFLAFFKALNVGNDNEKTGCVVIRCEDSIICLSDCNASGTLGRGLSGKKQKRTEKRDKAPIENDGKSSFKDSVSVTRHKSSGPMQELKALMQRTGSCIYCFVEGTPTRGHFLSQCPRLNSICRKCFQPCKTKIHLDCPAKDSMPHNVGICYFCGLEPEHHAAETFGKSACTTWGNDKLITLALIFWCFDEKYALLKNPPKIARKDAGREEVLLVEFFKWLFEYDQRTYERNYVDFLMQCFRAMKK